jgi:serine/threonine-protein kinase
VSAGGPDDHDPAVADTPSPSVAGRLDTTAAGPRKGPRRIRTGDVLGRYELGEELGEGGMATVYRARDRELRRDVAVKVLFPHLARRPDIVRRFHREARAAAGLEHPNILRIYDVGGGEADDPPYIVMELIRGRTLLQEIEQRGAMLAEVAAGIGALLGDALSAAHAAGVIHRDVKPANVLIAPGGRLLLADFGVARLETEDSIVTRTGALLGTPAYMSPEQASGDTATARSDLYSLGATLYQLATGALPYAGPPAKMMSTIIAGSAVAPVRRRSACGPDLSRSIERLMASDPAERPASATVIAAELRALATAGGLGDPSEELAAYFEDPDGFLRARTPVVVASLVAAARAAIADDKLPRAMALADRASALAPADPEVAALIRAVTEGGHASRRKRMIAMASMVLLVGAGATALGLRIWGAPEDTAPPVAQLPVAQPPVAQPPPVAPPPAPPAVSPPAGPPAMEKVEEPATGSAAPPPPAVTRVELGAGRGTPRRPTQPAQEAVAHVSPSSPRQADGDPHDVAPITIVPVDAAVAVEVPVDAAAAPPAGGHLIVRNDLWCNIWIDDALHGDHRNKSIAVTAGHHVVRCVNPMSEWTREVDVPAGTTQTLRGPPLADLQVTLDVDATINGKHYARGMVVKLKPARVEVSAGDKKDYITFRVSCTLRDSPTLGCYP